MRGRFVVAGWFLWWVCSGAEAGTRADAPYQLVAVYARDDGGEVAVPVHDGMLVPDGGKGLVLAGMRLTFKRASLGSTAPAVFRNFTAKVHGVGLTDRAVSVSTKEIAPTRDADVMRWDHTVDGGRIVELSIDVHGKFSAEFLCSQELLYRLEKGSPRPLEAKDDRPQYELKAEDGKELAYSFCETHREAKAWKSAAGKVNALTIRYKEELANRLIEEGALSRFNLPYLDQIVHEPDAPGRPPNVHIRDVISFTILRTSTLFTLTEIASDGRRDVARLIDQVSRLELSAASRDGLCPPVMRSPFVYQLREGDKDPKQLALSFRDGCRAALDVAFKDFLHRSMTFSVIYEFPDDAGTRLVVFEVPFDVENLGLITTFPLITEIQAALTRPSLRDVQATSSIPVGFAIPIGGGETGLAVTFPWTVSFNSRTSPRLADFMSVFAHVSIVSTDSAGGDIRPAFGAGVLLAQVLTIGWGATAKVGDRSRHYIFLGLSIPDLARLFSTAP